MRPPKSYLTTAFSAPMRTQKARIANLFAGDRRKGNAALAALCAVVLSLGALVSCRPAVPAPVPTVTPAPVTLSADAMFYDGAAAHTLGEGLSPILDDGDECLMPPHLDGRQVNRRWKNALDGSYRANSYYTVDRTTGALRLNCFQWTASTLSTARGAKVGDSLADVQALYPEAELKPDLLYFRDDACEVFFDLHEDAVAQISLYTDRFPVTVESAFPFNAVPLAGVSADCVLPAYSTAPSGLTPPTVTAAELDAAADYRYPGFTDELVRVAERDGWALYCLGGRELLRSGGRWAWFDLPWDQTIKPAPDLWPGDYDGDGKDELAIACFGGGNEIRYGYLYLLSPEDEVWSLEAPVPDAIRLEAAFTADRGALLLQADHAVLAIDSAGLEPDLVKYADALSVDFGRAAAFHQRGSTLSVTLPILLCEPNAGDLQSAPDGAIVQEVAALSADVVYLPGAECWTYTNFKLDTDLKSLPMPKFQPPELQYQTTVSLDPNTDLRRETLVTGEVPLDCFFEVPVFTETGAGYDAINDFFSDLSKQFFTPENDNLTEAWTAAIHSPRATGNSPFYYRHSAVIRSQDDSLVSVTIEWDWWIGGVHNSGWDCYNFDPVTGKQVLLSDLIAERENAALDSIRAALDAADMGYTMPDHALDQFDFYVEDGKVYLAFDSYEVTCGAGGSPVLEVPLHRRLPACPPSAIDSTAELP